MAPNWGPTKSKPKAFRLRFSNRAVELISMLSNLHRLEAWPFNMFVGVAPDGSLLLSDTGSQEVYALDVKWP